MHSTEEFFTQIRKSISPLTSTEFHEFITLGAHFRHRNLHQNAGKKYEARIFFSTIIDQSNSLRLFDENFESVGLYVLIIGPLK